MYRYFIVILIVFTATSVFAQQDLNLGFEEWSFAPNDTLPTNWYWSQFGAHLSADAHSGSYAVKIWNWYNYAKGTLSMGEAINMLQDVIKTGFPINKSYTSMSGYYKYVLGHNGGINDSAEVCVIGKRFNVITQKRDTVFFALKKLPPASEYMPFQIHIDVVDKNISADSIAIAFFSSESANCDIESTDGTCCYLTVDDLSLSTDAGVHNKNAEHSFLPSSNPFSNFTSFGNAPESGCTLAIYDLRGVKHIVHAYTSGEEMIIGSRELQNGFYIYEIMQPGMPLVHGKLIKN